MVVTDVMKALMNLSSVDAVSSMGNFHIQLKKISGKQNLLTTYILQYRQSCGVVLKWLNWTYAQMEKFCHCCI